MKNVIKISVFVFAFILMLASCKKEEMSLANPVLDLGDSDLAALNLYDNDLSISGKVAPEDASDGTIKIKITSTADPTGFEFTEDCKDGDLTEGDTKYLYKSFYTTISAANETDAAKKRIKVAETGDNITVTIGDNIISKTFKVNTEEVLTYTYWNADAMGSLFLYGYQYDEAATKILEVWSTRDDQRIPLTGEYSTTATEFGSYTFDVNFIDDWSQEENGIIGIYPEGDTIFVDLNDKVYFAPYNAFVAGILTEYPE